MLDADALKQHALMFDRIATPTLSSLLSVNHEDMQDIRRNLEWLIEKGVIFEPPNESKIRVSTTDY